MNFIFYGLLWNKSFTVSFWCLIQLKYGQNSVCAELMSDM